ncbi:MAG: HlyD family type I secretion periplasmic adaptor subunit [Kovacikia sp.]
MITSSSTPDPSDLQPQLQHQSVESERAIVPAQTLEMTRWSPALQEVLQSPPSKLPLYALTGALVLFAGVGAWSWFGQIDEVGKAQGKLVPQGSVYKLQVPETGKIARLPIKEGNQVRKGQVLVELDPESLYTEIALQRQLLNTAQLRLLQTEGLMVQSQAELTSHQQQAQAAQAVQASAIAQAQARSANLAQVVQQTEVDIKRHQERIARLNPLVSDGAISLEQVFAAEQAFRDREAQLTQHAGDLENAEQTIAQNRELLQKQRAEGNTAILQAQQRTQELRIQATQLHADISEIQSRLKIAEQRLNRRFIYAPINGTVTSMKNKVGEVIQPGQTIAELAPQKVPIVLEARLPNREAGFARVGMPVQIKLDAYPYQEFGMLSGRVQSISPDAQTDEKYANLGEVYKLKIKLDRSYIISNGRPVPLKIGQTANAEIVIRQRRIISFLFDPIEQLRKGGFSL